MTVKQKFYFTLTAVSVVLTVSAVLVFLFLFSEVKGASLNYAQNQIELLTLRQKSLSLKEFEKELEKIKPNLALIDGALLKEEDILTFVEKLEKIAEKTGNRHSISIVGTPSAGAGELPPFFSFRINTWGSFSSFMNFLKSLENMPIYTALSDVQFAKAAGGLVSADKTQVPLGPDDISAVLTIKVFSR